LSKKAFVRAAEAGAVLIAQVKENQRSLHHRVQQICQANPPLDSDTNRSQNRRSRDETRLVEVFDPAGALAGTEWAEHVGAVFRVQRTTHRRITATGLWETAHETAHFVTEYILPAAVAASAIRNHWGIENRLHYVRDCGFREDDSRIRSKPTVFARLRSFAANILRANNVQNLSDGRYRIAIAGLAGLRSLILM
jgi:hypothetical protein